jgi:hypothetical protein
VLGGWLAAGCGLLLGLTGTPGEQVGDRGEREAVLDAQDAAMSARRASLDPPNPQHPAIAGTMTAAALEGWTAWVTDAAADPSDAFLFAPPLQNTPLGVGIEEIDGAQIAFVTDCQLEQGQLARGAGIEPAPDPDPAHRTTRLGTDVLAKVDGHWKLALFMQLTPEQPGTLGCAAD